MTSSRFRGVAAFVLVLAAIVGGSAGRALTSNAATRLEWTPFSTEAYDRARRSGGPFVIEFAADWCAPCKEMRERTFTDSSVREAADGITLLSVDMTEPDDFIARVMRSFDVIAAPTTVFYGADGKEWKRRGGFIGPEEFVRLLRESRARKDDKAPSAAAERT